MSSGLAPFARNRVSEAPAVADPLRSTVPPKEKRPAGRHARLAGHLFVVALLAIWTAWGLSVESYQMPGPFAVAERLVQFFGDAHEVAHMFWSFGHILAAVIISFIIGSLAALLPWYARVTRRMMFHRFTPFLNSYPGIGWTMLAIIWFGVNDTTVVFVISMVLIPFAIINMREGLEAIDPELIEMSRSFSRSRWRSFAKIILPSLYPFIFASLRISFGVAWKITLTAELFGGNSGLGYLLNLARNDFDMPLIFGVIIIIIAFVYCTDRFLFDPIQRRLGRHHAT
jgi:NitT/TauT family transport system permease protein